MLTSEQFLIKYNIQKLMRQGIADDDHIRIGNALGINPTLVLQIINEYKSSVIDSANKIQNICKFQPKCVNKYKKVICIGDSNSSDRESYFNILKQLFIHDTNIDFIDSSISGATSSDFLNLTYTYAVNLEPHIAIIMLGTNDTRKNSDALSKNNISAEEYENNMRYIVGILNMNNITVIINTIPQTINQYQRDVYGENNWEYCSQDIMRYNNILRDIANEYPIIINDVDFDKNSINLEDFLSYDGIHLSKVGQEYIAVKLLPVLLNFLDG